MVGIDNERDLIFACKKGDHVAFETLIQRYQRMIHSLTYRMTGSLDDAEDIAQETFIHAWQQLHAFRTDAKFSSWIYRIAVNLSLNWRAREERRDALHQNWYDLEETNDANAFQIADKVQDAILKLPPKQLAAVILTTYEGLSHAEAAMALGCSVTTVSWRLFTARAKLKHLLEITYQEKATYERR